MRAQPAAWAWGGVRCVAWVCRVWEQQAHTQAHTGGSDSLEADTHVCGPSIMHSRQAAHTQVRSNGLFYH